MRVWCFRILAFLLFVACLLLTPAALEALPVEPLDYLQGEGPAWEGILTLGVVQAFDQGGLNSWLNAQARLFEKEREGTLLSISQMNVSEYRSLKAARALPDALILSGGVETDPEGTLLPISGGQAGLREALLRAGQRGGKQYGLPLALGAYGLLGDREWLDGEQLFPETPVEELCTALREKKRGIALPAPSFARPDLALEGMDPKLIALAETGVRARLWPDFALDRKYAFYLATQREVRRMEQLRAAGRGFATCMWTPGERCRGDLGLYLCVTAPAYSGHGGDAEERLAALGAFTARLLGEEAQAALADAGLFSAREGCRLYTEGDMAALEQSLERPMDAPNIFDEGQAGT